jgi:hypothetical protein
MEGWKPLCKANPGCALIRGPNGGKKFTMIGIDDGILVPLLTSRSRCLVKCTPNDVGYWLTLLCPRSSYALLNDCFPCLACPFLQPPSPSSSPSCSASYPRFSCLVFSAALVFQRWPRRASTLHDDSIPISPNTSSTPPAPRPPARERFVLSALIRYVHDFARAVELTVEGELYQLGWSNLSKGGMIKVAWSTAIMIGNQAFHPYKPQLSQLQLMYWSY